ncbi:PREDICTED: GDSL esterase/lipase At4g18970-like [Nelumbo nucifera]|uniref:GDSL esterase/lipase At4g18970-like n=1 Tax=Nelumbo nucifera TaxID=4432 RepID=A0A1U8B2I8_NELNU|nr:PREDICTED: GDSL esterase/lipase At4g18970-like [Nelumbo nucifera]
MGCEVVKKKMWKVCTVVLVLAAGGVNLWGGRVVQAEAEVPCYFIFGDSLVDDGNNNQLSSLARADYMPYGIDFDGGPTGRFRNGKTTTDVIAQLLGFDDYIPPYATTGGQDLLKGVNFASAAAGIRDETGRHFGDRISMNRQVRNYQSVFSQIVEILGDEASAKDHLSKCIFTVGMGSNDYLNNYFMPLYYTTSQEYTPEQYADALIQEYTGQLKTLYNYGARKVSLFGVGQIGCTPNELAKNSPNGVTCVDRINVANQMFNNKLKALVNDFNNNLVGTKFTYINANGIFEDMLKNPSAYGFTVTNTGCCGMGQNNGQITCLPLQTPCQNRNQYLFWDAFHPTEAANVIVGGRSYRAQSSSDAYPVDIQHLARL